MRLTIDPITVDPDNPFGRDQLDRAGFGERLSNFVKNIDDNIVVALNAPWGEGKTTFVEMWRAHLEDQGVKSIYLDAFANDYLDDPFILIAAELNAFFEKEFSSNAAMAKILDNFRGMAVKVGSAVLSASAKLAVKTVTMGLLDSEDINDLKEDVVDSFTAGASSYIENKIINREEEVDAVKSFKCTLTEIATHIKDATGAPLIFIVDELDRCKPSFSIDLLEKVKHFFSAENTIFILVLNKTQLEASVKGVYGVHTDADEYLQKFLNLYINLPKRKDIERGDYKEYCVDLYEKHDLNIGKYEEGIITYITALSHYYDFSLRDIERCFTVLVIFYAAITESHFQPPWMVALLAVLRVKYPDAYRLLTERNITYEALAEKLDIASWSGRNLEFTNQYLQLAMLSDEELQNSMDGATISHLSQGLFNYSIGRDGIIPSLVAVFESFIILEEET